MRSFAVCLLVAVCAACGSQESATGNGGVEAVEAESAGALSDVAAGAGEAVAPIVKRCLDLVAAESFAEAVPVCARAVAEHPDAAEAESALARAQQAAGIAAAEGAASQRLGRGAPQEGQAPGLLGAPPE